MNKILLFVALPCMVTLVLCMNYGQPYGYMPYNYHGSNYGGYYGGQGYGGGGKGGYGYYGGKGGVYSRGAPVQLRNYVYYSQPTPYLTFGNNAGQQDDSLLLLFLFFLTFYAFNLTGTVGTGTGLFG